MLFLLLAALSARSVPVPEVFASLIFCSVVLSPLDFVDSVLPLDGTPGFLSLSVALLSEELLARLVALLTFTLPLTVRLCSDGRAPSGFSEVRSATVFELVAEGIAECRRAFRAAFASSLIRGRGLTAVSAGDESVKSNTAKLSFFSSSCLMVDLVSGRT